MFCRALGLRSVDPQNQAVLSAWSALHSEAEALISQAMAAQSGVTTEMQVQTAL